jgi:ribose/xylose/arabinose/galactoside ABC-type transport system permease subunit
LEFISRNGIWIALAALIAFNVVASNGFLSWQTLQTNLGQMSTVAICAVGMTFIIAKGGIDLSVGSQMAVAGAVSGAIITSWSGLTSVPMVGLIVVLTAAMLSAAVLGAANGFLVANLRVQPIVATLVVMITGRGLAQLMTSGRLYEITNSQDLNLGRGTILGLPTMAWVMVIVVVLATWMNRKTVFGRQVFAVGGNRIAAGLAGVPVRRVTYTVYMASAALAGLAAVLSVGVNGTVDTANLGLGYEFTVISAVVVGGTSLTGGKPRVLGTIGGVALLQLLSYTLASHNIATEISSLVQAGVILLAVASQLRRKS